MSDHPGRPTSEQLALARASYKVFSERRPALFLDFYTRLFTVLPKARAMFPPDPTDQASKLDSTVQVALSALETPDAFVPLLESLGRTHKVHGVKDEDYAFVSEFLVDSFKAASAEDWTPETDAAWQSILTFITEHMIDGAHRRDPDPS